ncbi:MAG: phosphonate ABC transporter, permease protein PhnE [Sheuella sp.]|jgi:phosphonate transport system permease protein|nr:phosphonate ABC transporter, permease protein PhnE [Sheuella sp.]
MNIYPKPAMPWRGFALSLVCIAAVCASFSFLQFNPFELFSTQSLSSMRTFVARFFSPDLSPDFLLKVAYGTIETLAISAVATLLAALFGLLFALPATGRFGQLLKQSVRLLLNFLRAVPELVWATLMVLLVGLGPFAGTLALALHTIGVLGRLFAETLENRSDDAARALILSGARPFTAFFYGTLPAVAPQLLSYTLYRWEMNIRMATILGFVGAGGLGQILYYELSLLRESQASTALIAMFVLVIAVDALSARLRRIQIHCAG